MILFLWNQSEGRMWTEFPSIPQSDMVCKTRFLPPCSGRYFALHPQNTQMDLKNYRRCYRCRGVRFDRR